MASTPDHASAFLEAASVPLNAWHSSGGLYEANRILAENPEVATSSIYAAAVLGDAQRIKDFLYEDRESATRPGGPHNWDPLTYLCFSRYLKLDRSKSEGFVEAAKALLAVGASATTGWWENSHSPKPEWESVLYGACGIAHHPELTQLLLDNGADPNDGETVYHTPETFDNRSLHVLVNTKKLTPESLALLLIRKADWHDYEGAKWLLENGADPNHVWGNTTPFLQAIRRDNGAPIFEVLLDHGAAPTIAINGVSPISFAAYRGRGDLLDLFAGRGMRQEVEPLEALIAACAQNDEPRVREIGMKHPVVIEGLRQHGGDLLFNFAANGNTEGVRLLLETGAPIWSVSKDGDGYYGLAENSTPLHAAAWRIRPSTVKLLIARSADVNALDARNRTPLMLAVKANTESYWTDRKTPETVEALLAAGAKIKGVERLSGYEEVDKLLTDAGLGASER